MAVASANETVLKLTLTHHVNAAPEKVFEAWLDPQLLCKWIGPREWVESCEVAVLEPRVGGRYELRTSSRAIPGRDACKGGVRGVYRRIDRHTRLAFTWAREGEDAESLVTVLFEPAEKGTLVTLTHEGFICEQVRDQHLAGWSGSLPQLADLLELRITLKQQVNAPPQRVFDALLDPKLVCRWLGPRSMVETCEVLTLEPRVGGRYRLRMQRRPDSPTGPGDLFVAGVYLQIDRPHRLAYSWSWDHQPHESRVAYELKPHAGGTEVTLTHEGFADANTRQSHSLGWTVSLQQLAEVLQSGA